MKLRLALGAFALAGLLAACNAETPAATETAEAPAAPEAPAEPAAPAAPTPAELIDARQAKLKEMGGAMKTIGDNLKSGSPSLEVIRPAADTLKGHGAELASWFPAGTGPEAGVETEALPVIWTDAAGFQAAADKLVAETTKLAELAAGEDVSVIGAQVGAVGGSCKGCHDTFRLKKD